MEAGNPALPGSVLWALNGWAAAGVRVSPLPSTSSRHRPGQQGGASYPRWSHMSLISWWARAQSPGQGDQGHQATLHILLPGNPQGSWPSKF